MSGEREMGLEVLGGFPWVFPDAAIRPPTDGRRVLTQEEIDTFIANGYRFELGDLNLAFDINGVAGQAYRLYKAAFDREPDHEGLGFWIHYMDNGNGNDLQSVAQEFIDSQEFKNLYGEDSSNRDFLTALYNNVLDRGPDGDGFDWWLNVLDAGVDTREGVLMGFSESAENQNNVIGLIGNGIVYDDWGA